MIEALSKVAEVAPKGAETKSSFDPDKKIGKGEVSNSNEAKAKDKSYDTDKKLNKDKTSQKDAKESDAKSDSEQQNEVEKNKMEPPVVIRFKCPEGVDPKEFERQLKAQERGLNSQTVAENKKNREAYEARKEETGNGRDVESKKAQEFATELAKKFSIPNVVITGISITKEKIGEVGVTDGKNWSLIQKKLSGSFFGTGDMFASAFLAAVLHGNNLEKSCSIAADFIRLAIMNTKQNPLFGPNYAAGLPWLLDEIEKQV